MKPSIALQTHRKEIRRIVAANRASNARVFGSVAAGEDSDGSDLDLLVDPYTHSDRGRVRITAFMSADIAVRRAASFAAMVDALTPSA